MLRWCQYVLEGILTEVEKITRLTDFDYLLNRILLPTLDYALEREYVTKQEANVIRAGLAEQTFKAGDLDHAFKNATKRQRTHLIAKMKHAGFVRPTKESGRTYYVNFINNHLMRGLIRVMEQEGFTPPIDS